MSRKAAFHVRTLSILMAGTMLAVMQPATASAERRTLLEQWFPKAAERIKLQREQRLREMGLLEEKPEPKPIARVSGPQYYTYRTEEVRGIRLASLLPEPAVSSSDTTGSTSAAGTSDSVQPVSSQASGTQMAAAGNPVSTDAAEPASQTGLVLSRAALDGVELKAETGIAEAIEKHYSADPRMLWIGADGLPNASARTVMGLLAAAGDFGMDPQDYAVSFDEAQPNRESETARFEIAMTAAVLRYASDAENGIVNPNRISGYHDFPAYRRDYAADLAQIAGSAKRLRTLLDFHPDNAEYRSLKDELRGLRAIAGDSGIEPIEPGTLIKPGQSHQELPKVIRAIRVKADEEFRAVHRDILDTYSGSELYDEALAGLVRDFQKTNGLGPDGIIGRNTIAKLTGELPQARIAKVELAMERMRWLPHQDLGYRHVFINQPAFNVDYMVGGKPQLSMRVVVGTPKNQTSFFYDEIELVEFNPYWNVPRSILVNEMLNRVQTDPGYLSARNYEVVAPGGKVIDSGSVDWYSESSTRNYYVRQRPGGANALGELKILFPNSHDIYMHDTPAKDLFKRSERAYSHGCVRLQDPRAMAAAVLGTTKDEIGQYIAQGRNQTVPVKNKIPVYVAYFTAWPTPDGTVAYYNDVYGRDGALSKALKATRDLRETILQPVS